MSGVWARYVKRSLCECGFPVLEESVPIGKLYLVDPNTIRDGGGIICGGCGKKLYCELIEVWDEGAGRQATLPAGILEIGEAA
jgi:hypothetical protein